MIRAYLRSMPTHHTHTHTHTHSLTHDVLRLVKITADVFLDLCRQSFSTNTDTIVNDYRVRGDFSFRKDTPVDRAYSSWPRSHVPVSGRPA